jgi:phage portal protein BeeE
MWSNGEREPNALTDSLTGPLVSYEHVYRSQPAVRTAVDKLSKRIATLPFDAFNRTDNGGREIDQSSTLDSLIHKPWPRAGAVHLNSVIAQSLALHGNSLVAKLRTADREAPPFMLWPLDWAQINAYGPPGGRIEWWSTYQFDGEERFIAVEDTLHFAWPAPSGLGDRRRPLESLGMTLAIEAAAQQYQAARFRAATGRRWR